MRKGLCVVAALLIGATGVWAEEMKTDQDKTLYALGQLVGQQVGRSVKVFDMNKSEQALFLSGFRDALDGAPSQVDMKVFGPKVNEMAQARGKARSDAEQARAKPALEAAAKEKGAVKTDSGLIYIEQKAGTGAAPKPEDTVKVHYRGTLTDGSEFDSSYKRNEPVEFPLKQVIPCWTEGLQKMKVGGKAKLVCPASIAYGEQGNQAIPGGATLTFDVELLEIKAPPPPTDVKAPATPATPAAPATPPPADTPKPKK